MAIDTKIEGNPENIRNVSRWLRDSLAKSVSEAATQIHTSRRNAEDGWQGPAGEAFSSKMTTGAKKTDEFSSAITKAAQDTDTYAAKLQRAQNDMRAVRERATAAGLTVNNHVIEDPGPGPATPDAAPTGAAVNSEGGDAHQKTVAGSKAHEDKVTAYNTAKTESDAAHNLAKFAADTLNNVWSDITNKWFVVVGDLTNGAVGTLAAKHSSILKKQSDFLADESARLLERARTAPAGTSSAQLYRDFDLGRSTAYQADDVAGAAKSTDTTSGKWGFRAGGALAVAGVAYDIANGKPPVQATVSGGAGFAASVGAGAAIGTMIPVPVLGTAVGAVGGAAAGLFASGAVDSLFQNGAGGVGGAIEEGAKTVGDTGKAIGGLAEDAWDAVF